MSAKRLRLASALVALSFAAAAAADDGIPSISSAGLVNAATGQPTFAPYSICTIYGTDLYPDGTASANAGDQVPDVLGGVTVLIGSIRAGIFYISPNQINVLIPNSFTPSTSTITVVRNGLASQSVPITLQEVAPGLFPLAPGYAVALHADGTPVTEDAPAVPGEVVLLYGTGFGRTQPDPSDRSVPTSAAPIIHMADFEVLLDGVPLDPTMVQYAGIAPFNAGLYQVNVRLPANLSATNPQLQVSVAGTLSPPGLSLITGPLASQ